MFLGIGCFEGTFTLLVKEGSQPYQVPPRRLAYALQETLMEELEGLERQQVYNPTRN